MGKVLIKTTEQYRVDTMEEAETLIQEAREEKGFTLIKYSNEYKTAKEKGEIVDEWQRVILVKEFAEEKNKE